MSGWWSRRSASWVDASYVVGYLAVGALLHVLLPDLGLRWTDVPVPPAWAVLGLLAVAALGLTQRRSRPVLGLVGACAALLGLVQLGYVPLAALLVLGDLLYCAVLHTSDRLSRAVTGTAAAVAAGAALVSLVADGGRAALLVVLNLGLLLAVPVLWGREVRLHSKQAEAERERAEQASRMAELDRAAAVASERSRMARDLHDVIAGQLSGIAIQSAAVLSLPDPDPAVLRKVLQSVRRDSVASLAEMRTMIGLLRADGAADDDPRTAPAGLDRLPELLESAGGTGLRIEVADARGAGPAAVPAAVDLAAFRIVQESLTNAAKHAPGSRVHLSLDDRDGELVIEIENDMVPGAPSGGGTGTGLLGLRERADAVGGRVGAGPDGGRWRVRAVLPARAAAEAGR